MTGPLPHGAALRPLEPHDDERGTFTELFRAEWLAGISAPVWG